MITIISASEAASKAVSKLDNNKYNLILLFSDAMSQKKYKDYNTILIGKKTLYGCGTGGSIASGIRAFEESMPQILTHITTNKVIIVGCTGGGMSAGIPLLVQQLKELGKKVFVIASKPTAFENNMDKTVTVLNMIRDVTNDLAIIDYQNLLERTKEKPFLLDFYDTCDDYINDKIIDLINTGW